MKYFTVRSLAVKQFLFSSLLFSLIFFIFFFSRLNEIERLNREILSRDTETKAVQLEIYFDEFFQGILNILFILESQDGFLEAGGIEKAQEMLRDIGDSNGRTIKMVYLIPAEGQVIASRQALYDSIGHEGIDRLRTEDFSSYQSLVLTDPYYTPLSGYTLAFIYPIKNKAGIIMGLSMIELNLYSLGNYITTSTGDSKTTTVLLSEEGVSLSFDSFSVLSPPAKDIYPFVIEEELSLIVGAQNSGESRFTYRGKNYMLYKTFLDRFRWQLCILLDQETYDRGIKKTRRDMMLIGALILFFLLIGSSLLSIYFAQPIHNLAQFMSKGEDVENSTLPTLKRKDEIGNLYVSYNTLINRLGQLLREIKKTEEEKRHYEISMLQNQITPHFLLNTLACIRSLARQGKNDQVSHTIKSLIGLLSYRLENQGGEVSLAEEINSVSAYLDIQHIRYPDKFKIEIDLPRELISCKVIPLILQPIVENALFRGLLPCGVRGTLRIQCAVKHQILHIYIRDNGVGMTRATRASLLIKRERIISSEKRDFTKGHAIGVSNVHHRIQLYYGQEYGLSLYSLEGKGTVVLFKLPLMA